YSLVALGYTMVYGILQLINFAHGDIVMVGAVIALTVAKPLLASSGLPGPVVLAISAGAAVAVCVPLNIVIERVAYRPLRNAPRLAPLITAIGVSLTIQTIAMVFFGRNFHEFPALLPQNPIEWHGVVISATQIVILVLSLALMVGLGLLIERTEIGRSM